MSLVLFSLLSFSPLCFSCHAEVKLTDEEAQQILSEIQESRKDLKELQERLMNAEAQLYDVKSTYSEQRTSYERQLSDAGKENRNLRTAVTMTGTSTVIFACLMILFIFL